MMSMMSMTNEPSVTTARLRFYRSYQWPTIIHDYVDRRAFESSTNWRCFQKTLVDAPPTRNARITFDCGITEYFDETVERAA